LVENFYFFCKNVLNLQYFISTNSLKPSKDLKYRKYLNRVVIHPSSKDKNKNWPKKKFKKLCNKLKNFGYEPIFILTEIEKKEFLDIDIAKPSFNNLEEMASYIYESGYMIGNDSGVAHLASSLKIPTLTIFSTKRKERFWKPGFFIDKTVVSWPLINISHFRLREKYWKQTITVKRVLKNFIKLVQI
jgi:heptosyltransferase III